ncbi:MAG: hypothetical protein A2091_13020 [Desulfuromonadales bacterium GWD2_61_12]|nr:MAG: hypothetical protein A2091_13020 [Desulfuromonadales bacterium GWD2_61_12]
MIRGKDSIALDDVRSAMENLAQKHMCSIYDVEIAQVQSALGKGSNGTIGAFLKQVKQECINARAFDRANFSTQLKSAIKEEIDRFADNARENADEARSQLARDYVELSTLHANAEVHISELEKSIESQKIEADNENRRLAGELAKAIQKNESEKANIERYNTDLERSRSELSLAHAEVVSLTKKIGAFEASLEGMEDLVEKLNQETSKRVEAERNATLVTQAVLFKQETIDSLGRQTEKLDQNIIDLKGRISELSMLNVELNIKLEAANRELIEGLKITINKKLSSDKGGKAEKGGGKGKQIDDGALA